MTHFADRPPGHAPPEYPLELLPAERQTDHKIGHEVGLFSELNRTRY